MWLSRITTMANQILFVDDDLHVLENYKRMLRREFRIETACGCKEGLAAIHLLGPFAIVISSMNMPGLDGAEFLSRVRALSPQTVRMLLTGRKDLKRVIAAVNEGRIFRYLTKPCGKDELASAIRLGLAQYRTNKEHNEILKEARERFLNGAVEPPRDLLLVNE
jgi:DNA-binding NtrC family response regulator